MEALVATPAGSDRVQIREVPEPLAGRDEALVEVRAVSLNRGEVRSLATAQEGARPGWDVAGIIAAPASDGSGPPAGTRMVGLVQSGAWAQRVAIATARLAALPENVSFAAASTLPVAGMTAFRSLALGGLLLGKRVLITGAAGGVGRFAVQLAARAGAHVIAVVGSPKRGEGLKALGAGEVVVGNWRQGEVYDVILESVGGASLAAALTHVAPDGVIVSFGNSSQEETTFNIGNFYGRSGAIMRAFVLFRELARENSGARDLTALASLVAAGRLDPQIAIEASWRKPGSVLSALMDRQVDGKAVLHVD
ncbi:MAG: zinc-binding dehydrogenase [Dehalococcoidia bacterium]